MSWKRWYMPKSLPGPGPAPAHRDRLQGVESRRALRVPVSVGYKKEGFDKSNNSHRESLGSDWGSCLCSQPCCFPGSWQVRVPEDAGHICRSGITTAPRDGELLKFVNDPLCPTFHGRVHTPNRAGEKRPLEIFWSTHHSLHKARSGSHLIGT